MHLVVTIDTEEDNWGEYARESYSVENIRRIPRLQDVFNKRGIRPTYLVTYPVATDPMAVAILNGYRQQGLCEIGTHPHPWNTPPLIEDRTPHNSFISNLPSALQLEKIQTLTDVIATNFGVRPTSHRSGRWGFSEEIARHLMRLGYTVDTSISSRLDWREYGGPDYSRLSCEPFTFRPQDPLDGSAALLEVPATVDFVQGPSRLVNAAYRAIKSGIPTGRKVLGALGRLGVINLVCISPELADAPQMIRLTKALLKRGTRVVNMFFHSPSLLEGCSPYVSTPDELTAFLARIDRILEFAQSAGVSFATMSELPATGLGASTVRTLHVSDGSEWSLH